MALTLIKETGTGVAGANSYADGADGDAYHDGHLYGSTWAEAATTRKDAALVMATRLIDGCYQFNGVKATDAQGLQWPRERCPDPDRDGGDYFEADKVPVAVRNATCELARELLKADSTDAVEGEGISQLSIANSIFIQFHKGDKQPVIARTAQIFLMKLGVYLGGKGGMTKLVRV